MIRRVWLLDRPTLAGSIRRGGRVLASDTEGWRRPDGTVWLCHGNGRCDALAVWRSCDGWTTGYYCGRHLSERPSGEPVQICIVCDGPMSRTVTGSDETTHPTCDQKPTAAIPTLDEAVALIEETLGGEVIAIKETP